MSHIFNRAFEFLKFVVNRKLGALALNLLVLTNTAQCFASEIYSILSCSDFVDFRHVECTFFVQSIFNYLWHALVLMIYSGITNNS